MPIPVDKAMQLVQAAHAEAEAIDLAITAVVVDESGRLVALGRMDGARPISVDIAMNKAYTAASFRQSTDELKSAANQAWFQSLIVSSNGKVTAGGGAIPIQDAGQIVGAIAVAGGTDEQDHRCAEVALRQFG
jgi:uncharacterized protein GlcG (DUF336 family)